MANEPTLNDNISLFNSFLKKLKKNQKDNLKYSQLAIEVKKRLNQLDFLIKKIEYLENLVKYPSKTTTKINSRNDFFETSLEIELLTESFYYIGFRLIKIIQYFPELDKKFDANGIRDVRNHLLEHPHGNSSKIFVQSFCHGGPNGPVIKGGRFESELEIYPDQGFFLNAREFSSNFDSVLRRAIEKF